MLKKYKNRSIIPDMIKYLFLILISFKALSETRQKIVVIDTGISVEQSTSNYMCKNGVLGTAGSWIDFNGHGQNVVGLIAKHINPKKTCIVSIKLDFMRMDTLESMIVKSMRMAELHRPVAINISMAGTFRSELELRYLTKFISSGVKVIVAAGNEGANLDEKCEIYPVCYLKEMREKTKPVNTSNFFVVGAKNLIVSNTGSLITVIAEGIKQGVPALTGTSQATANFTGKLFSK